MILLSSFVSDTGEFIPNPCFYPPTLQAAVVQSSGQKGQETSFAADSYDARCSLFCFVSCQLEQQGVIGRRDKHAPSRAPVQKNRLLILKNGALNAAAGAHNTSQRMHKQIQHELLINGMGAGFLSSQSELPVIESQLWLHAGGF